MESEKLLNVAEVARLLSCADNHVRHLIESGRLAAADIGARNSHHWRILPSALARFLAETSEESTGGKE